jgi:hypothetical protein
VDRHCFDTNPDSDLDRHQNDTEPQQWKKTVGWFGRKVFSRLGIESLRLTRQAQRATMECVTWDLNGSAGMLADFWVGVIFTHKIKIGENKKTER